jgi:hypothetical protein
VNGPPRRRILFAAGAVATPLLMRLLGVRGRIGHRFAG